MVNGLAGICYRSSSCSCSGRGCWILTDFSPSYDLQINSEIKEQTSASKLGDFKQKFKV